MNTSITLESILSLDMLQVVTGLVNNAAEAFGLNNGTLNHAVLATEEVFVYLVSHSGESRDLTVQVMNGGYYIRISFIFSPILIPAHVLNISSSTDPKDAGSLDDLEIFIAGRIADQFIYDRSSPEKTKIHLIIEKKYPEQVESLPPPGSVPEEMILSAGMNVEIKQASLRIISKYGHQAPTFFRFPGKVVDMVAIGDLRAILATDGKGTVFGCIMWKQAEHLIDLYGPYIFGGHETLGENLVQSMLESVGRSGAAGVVNQSPNSDTPASWFEELPSLSGLYKGSLRSVRHRYQAPLYRELGEDMGTAVIVHSDLVPAVRTYYSQMSLLRQIIPVSSAGEHSYEKTTFYVEIDKGQNRAVLTSCVIGSDAADTLSSHIRLLTDQGVSDIMYEMDLSNETDASLSPVLINAGFSPEYILPWGGHGDTLIFRYRTERDDV